MPPRDMANILNDLYVDNRRTPYWITKGEFKKLAHKQRLRNSYVKAVRAHLRDDGYKLVYFRGIERFVVIHFTAVTGSSGINHATNVDEYVLEVSA